MKVGNETRCDGCGCRMDTEDIVLNNGALAFCEASCVHDYVEHRVPAGHRARWLAQMKPDGWRKLGSSEGF